MSTGTLREVDGESLETAREMVGLLSGETAPSSFEPLPQGTRVAVAYLPTNGDEWRVHHGWLTKAHRSATEWCLHYSASESDYRVELRVERGPERSTVYRWQNGRWVRHSTPGRAQMFTVADGTDTDPDAEAVISEVRE